MPKLYKNQKQGFFIAILICTILFSFLIVRFSTSEDYWLCKDGSWIKHGNPDTSYPVSVCPSANTKNFTTNNVVENFYNWYFHSDGGIIKNNLYKNSDYLSQNFQNSINKKITSDSNAFNPFVCNNRADFPISFSVQEIYNKKNKAIVMVFQNYDTSQDRLEVTLYKKNDMWLINNVVCNEPFNGIKDIDITGNVIELSQSSIYFSNPKLGENSEDCSEVFPVTRDVRLISDQKNYLKNVLNQLFLGPNNEEKDSGYTSFFSGQTKSILKDIIVASNTVYINFQDIRSLLSNVTSSCGFQQFDSSLTKTVLSSSNAKKVIFAIDGDVQKFYDWVQVGCNSENNNCDSSVFSQ